MHEHRTATHILHPSIHLYLSFLYPRETGSNDAERTPRNKKAPDLGNPWFHPRRVISTLDVDSAISMYPVKSSVCTTTLKQASSEVHNLSIGYTTHTPSISGIIVQFLPH